MATPLQDAQQAGRVLVLRAQEAKLAAALAEVRLELDVAEQLAAGPVRGAAS